MANPDVTNETRVVSMLGQPWADDASDIATNLRSVTDVAAYYAKWSHYSWMNAAVRMFATFRNLRQLRHCGFWTDFGLLEDDELTLDSPVVEIQDASAKDSSASQVVRAYAGTP
jgi:hypothetical protein